MWEALIGFVLGVVVMLGVLLTWRAEVGAAQWGKQLEALRDSVPPAVELTDVRIKFSGVPADDGGVDLLDDKGEGW